LEENSIVFIFIHPTEQDTAHQQLRITAMTFIYFDTKNVELSPDVTCRG